MPLGYFTLQLNNKDVLSVGNGDIPSEPYNQRVIFSSSGVLLKFQCRDPADSIVKLTQVETGRDSRTTGSPEARYTAPPILYTDCRDIDQKMKPILDRINQNCRYP